MHVFPGFGNTPWRTSVLNSSISIGHYGSVGSLKKSASTPSLPESETGNMNRTMQNSSAFSANSDNLSVNWYPIGKTAHLIVASINMGLVIFGTIGNIMTLAVFRMYRRSSKSSATFLMQALCVVDTLYLLSLVPTEWMYKYMKWDLGKKYETKKWVSSGGIKICSGFICLWRCTTNFDKFMWWPDVQTWPVIMSLNETRYYLIINSQKTAKL